MEPTDEKLLFNKIKNGDEQTFEILFKNYYSFLCHFASQFLTDDIIAEEVVQDIFVKLWEKRESIVIETSVKSYLFRMVKNQCLNIIQHNKIKNQYAEKVKETPLLNQTTSDFYNAVELSQAIEESINSMPDKRKEIFRLSREEGLKYKEIAEKLKISIKTVEAQMGIALKYLREKLKEYNHIFSFFLFLKN